MSDDRHTYTVEEAARILGIGRNSAYEAIHRGEIPAIRIGRRVVVPRKALDDLLAGRSPEPDSVHNEPPRFAVRRREVEG